MTDTGGMGGFGEVGIGGTVAFNPRGRSMFQRAMFGRQPVTGNVSASLKFDIPGLRDFRTELEAIRKALDQLDATFSKMTKAPQKWAESLAQANRELKEMKANTGGGGIGGGGSGSLITPSGQRAGGTSVLSALGQNANVLGAGGGGRVASFVNNMQGIAAPGTPGGAASGFAGAIAGAVTAAMTAMFNRFDRGMNTAIASDVYTSRTATFTGLSPAQQAGRLAANRFGGMMGTMEDINRTIYSGASYGAFVGGGGVAGQRGGAYQQSIAFQQQLAPGMSVTEAGGLFQGAVGNVRGQQNARWLFGSAALMYNKGGTMKTLPEYFRGLMKQIETMPRIGKTKPGAWSKEELMAQRFPGSNMNAVLAQVFSGNPDLQEAWWEWAINNAATMDLTGTALSSNAQTAAGQLNRVRGLGPEGGLATGQQQLQTTEAVRDAKFTARQYGTMRDRLEREEDVVGMLSHIDGWLEKIYNVLGGTPTAAQNILGRLGGAAAGALAGAGIGLAAGGVGAIPGAIIGGLAGFGLSGDPGFMGDAEGGLSHLTPDLRARVDRMMGDNPTLRINSAYRDNLRQSRLQGRGPFAPSGKSKHGRGQAIDLGPSSQHGWLAANARRYGLETAGRFGEPWHVQLSGTTSGVGDPTSDARAAVAAAMQRNVQQAMADTAAVVTATPSGGGVSTSGGATTPSGGTGALSADEMVRLAYQAGFRGENLVTIVGIANRESGWNPSAHNPNAGTGDNSYGLTQINMINSLGPARLRQFGLSSNEDLLDPLTNLRAAFQMSGGTNFHAWGGYKGMSNTYNVRQEAFDQARAAAQAAGYMGDAGYSNGSAGPMANVSLRGGVTFHNTFNIQGMTGSRQTVDTAVRQISSRLESQMARVVTRSS